MGGGPPKAPSAWEGAELIPFFRLEVCLNSATYLLSVMLLSCSYAHHRNRSADSSGGISKTYRRGETKLSTYECLSVAGLT